MPASVVLDGTNRFGTTRPGLDPRFGGSRLTRMYEHDAV
jgi:hypothetical protein